MEIARIVYYMLEVKTMEPNVDLINVIIGKSFWKMELVRIARLILDLVMVD